MHEDDDDDVREDVTTLLSRKVDPSPLPEVRFALVATSGPDTGARIVVDGERPSRALVGTSTVCDLRLGDHEVSRRHAALEIEGDLLRVSDLRSKNGTFVNGAQVVEALLAGGELLRVGRTTFEVERGPGGGSGPLPAAARFGRFVGGSTEVRRLYPLCARLAATSVPVIIEGETGTGKEVLAEALHEEGPRASGPFVVFDCTQVPATLVESELFGHERGAFTGAVAARRGVFEQAHGGTLLIDEIGDLDLALQPKLLRALERGEVRRVGGDRFMRVDVRIIAATRRDLDRQVQEGRFRDDLFHRLAVARIELPPLRRRRGDVSILVQHFERELGARGSAIPAGVLSRWEDYEWPGNVRELRNAVARRVALGDLAHWQTGAAPGEDGEEDARAEAASGAAAQMEFFEQVLAERLPLVTARERVVEEFERLYIERTLADHGGSVARAAEASGVARRHFQRLKARSKRRSD
jgi:DNA-binding NtrC family response regulator